MTAGEVVAGSARPSGVVQIKRGSLIGVALVAIGLVALLGADRGRSPSAARAWVGAPGPSSRAMTELEALDGYGKLPLAFVPNAGQTDARVRYSARAAGVSFYFTPAQAIFAFTKGKRGSVLRLAFLGANPQPRIEGQRVGTGKVNYLVGSDPAKWRTNLPTYGQVVYRNLWPGVDMVFRGATGRLKYEFLLRPGARVSDIRLAYWGTSGLSLGRGGALRVQTPLGLLTDTAPRSYQLAGGKRVTVGSRYVLHGQRVYGFAPGAGYNPRRTLVIDPGLVYSTYLGGTTFDQGISIAVDSAGRAYVTGITDSPNFPTTPGAIQPASAGGFEAFVTKLNPSGSALVYSTYLGGSVGDQGSGIAVDSAGRAYVSGFTNSPNFPTTPGAFQPAFGGGFGDAFVVKLNASGSALLYSTYLGGFAFEQGIGIAVDSAGDAYVTGDSFSPNFPTTPGAFDTSFNGSRDAFATRLNASGSALVYSTYLGGSTFEQGSGIAVDSAGRAYVTGPTDSPNFPTTPGAFQPASAGGRDTFVTKLNASGSALGYSTYLGGSLNDDAVAVAVDSAGRAYVTGPTDSPNFPTTPGAFQPASAGGRDAFVTKLNASGSALAYSTYLGGSLNDEVIYGIGVDSAGRAYVAGGTDSLNFPTTPGAFQPASAGGRDAFVTKLDLVPACPVEGDDDADDDGLDDADESIFLTLLNNLDSDNDGIKDGNDDANRNGVDDEDEDDEFECPDDLNGNGIDDEDEDD